MPIECDEVSFPIAPLELFDPQIRNRKRNPQWYSCKEVNGGGVPLAAPWTDNMRKVFAVGAERIAKRELAMMVAVPGSDSQRNAERKVFRIAYTRTKWKLFSLAESKQEPGRG